MLRITLVIFVLWVFHSRAHLESSSDPLKLNLTQVSNVTSEDTPVGHGKIAGAEIRAGERVWRRPDFGQQPKAVGYTSKSFEIPSGLEKPVQFWTDIYTKFHSGQGVIHDSEWIDLVYEIVDFTAIENNSSYSGREKEKLKRKMVNDAKERASATLKRLAVIDSDSQVDLRDRRVWDYMKKVINKNKFQEANEKNRIRFQLGQSDRMKSAIFFSGRYLEDFEEIFKQHNLPLELTRLVFVESSFNVLARSKVGASGLWQIMPSVARPQRMMNAYVDRRNDPWDATRMAARLLASNYRMLEDWPLAITGYNHGPTGVRKMVNKYRTNDLVDLIQNVRSRRSFGFASRNFYPSFLAALGVEKNADKYFPGIKWSEKLKTLPVTIPVPVAYAELLRAFDNDRNQAEIVNPHLTHRVKSRKSNIPAGTKIYVPTDKISWFDKSNVRRVAVEATPKKTSPMNSR